MTEQTRTATLSSFVRGRPLSRGGRSLTAGLVILAVSAGVLALLQVTVSGYVMTLIAFALLHVMLAVSLQLTNGLTGLFSLGHPGFMTVGGYTAALLTFPASRKEFMLPALPEFIRTAEWGLLPASLAGGVTAALVAVVIGFPVLRLRGHYLAVATLGFIIIVRVLFNNAEDWTRGALGLNGLPYLTNIWWVFGFTALTVFVAWRIKHASLGRAMMSVRENEMAAACSGINPARVKMLAFVIGAFFAGIAGALWTHLVTAITPGSFSIMLAFMLVVMVVIGGTGSITGAILAALAIVGLDEALKVLQTEFGVYGLSQIIIALGVILVLIFRPRGLFGSAEPRIFGGR